MADDKKTKGKSRISPLVRLLGIVAFVYIVCRIILVILKLLNLNDYSWITTFDMICDYVVIITFAILAFFWAISGKKKFILKIILIVIIGVAIAFLLGYMPSVKEWIAGLVSDTNNNVEELLR